MADLRASIDLPSEEELSSRVGENTVGGAVNNKNVGARAAKRLIKYIAFIGEEIRSVSLSI